MVRQFRNPAADAVPADDDPWRGGVGLCYLILILDNVIDLVHCLWSIWDDQNTYILLVDVKSGSACKSLCAMLAARFENIRCITEHNGSWGGYSLVSATLAGMRAALGCGRDWRHLFLISGNHVALTDQNAIKDSLEAGKSYLRSEGIPRLERPSDEQFLASPGIQRRLWGWFEEIPGIKPVMTGIRAELPDIPFFKGSQWMALPRTTCEALLHPRTSALCEFFAHTFVPDETFFHTMVRWIEPRENMLSLHTTLDRWNGGQAVYLNESSYEAAAQSGRWFARKLPKTISASFVEAIQRRCNCIHLDTFVEQANLGAACGGTIVRVGDEWILPETGSDEGALLQSKHEQVISRLREIAGPGATFVRLGSRHLETWIEPAALRQCPAIGVVRGTDGRTVWLTIQVQAALYSEAVRSKLMSSNYLGEVIGEGFEETHLEPHFREFFRRELRTAYLFDADRLDSAEAGSRLVEFFHLLTEAWRVLGL